MPIKKQTPALRNQLNADSKPFELFNGTLSEMLDKLKTCDLTHNTHYFNNAWIGDTISDMKEACQRLEDGSPELLKKYKQVERESFKTLQSFKTTYQPATEGLYYSIPDFLEGLPEHWQQEQEEPAPGKNGDILINVAAAGVVDVKTIMDKLVNIAHLIDTAEGNGQRLNVYLCLQGKQSKPIASSKYNKPHVKVLIKRDSEPVNLQQLIYLVSTPIVLRFCFHILYAQYVGSKYGLCYQDPEEETKLIKDSDLIYIPSVYYDEANYINSYTDLTTVYPHLKDKI